MKAALRLLASVKSARYLEPGNPTGLTGLYNHPAPRSTLLYLYSTTLDRLKELPEHSVYRQSVEALTKHRKSLVESVKPEGFDDWAAKSKQNSQAERRNIAEDSSSDEIELDGRRFTLRRASFGEQDTSREWDGQPVIEPKEGSRSPEENVKFPPEVMAAYKSFDQSRVKSSTQVHETEPPLDVSQVQELENKLEAGLLEEVILVAEGELKLVNTMLDSRVWEELEEKVPKGQWDYFARDQHQPGTQEPPVEKKS